MHTLKHNSDNDEPFLIKEENMEEYSPLRKLKRWQWWLLVAINIFFLIAGQCATVLLGKFYYYQGGNSKWIATLVQTAAFPILYIPLIMIPYFSKNDSPIPPGFRSPSIGVLALIYLVLGAIVDGDDMLYSVGILCLSASTYSLICASQLVFNAVFSYFINLQKLTTYILISIAVLSLSAALIAVDDDSEGPSGVSQRKYIIGFVCTLPASALKSLLLSLMQVSFEKVIKKETFSVVLEMLIYTCFVATCVSVVGLFASGEWRTLHGEMQNFGTGRVSYILTLVWTAVTWQVCSVGVVGLTFLVSSLFSNVMGTFALAVSPISAVIVFHDKMDGVKIIAMLPAMLGLGCYTYQNYLDDLEIRRIQREVSTTVTESSC